MVRSHRYVPACAVGLTGKGGGKMAKLVDILLDADSGLTPRIQETHGFIIHAVCDLVERILCEPD